MEIKEIREAAFFLNHIPDKNKIDPKGFRERLNKSVELLYRLEKYEAILQLVEEKKILPEINNDGKIVFVSGKKVFFSL